ncbi:MAG TPA: ATP-binding protein [Candidatus Wunengus sp. YC60]|uniref:ATP-binding protein n=1 Tax=Candidatus Wunengus sp. YC60 TaxID=3367697 RepID=UPI004026D741
MMDVNKVQILVQEGEGLTVEFKEHFTPRIDEDIVAFANTKGGVILLGVRDDRTVSCEKLTNDMKARINSVARNCNPPVQVKIKQLQNIIAVEVPQGEEKPYNCSSGYFRRLDGTTQKMSNHELRIMFQEHEATPFEEKANKDVTWDDISKEKIQNFLKEANINIRKISPRDILTSLSIARDDRIANAGVLFFAKNPRKFILQSQMTLIAFKGTDRVHIYDRQDVQDDLLTQFNAAVFFLMKHLNRRSEIKGVNRKDIYEIPFEALREAIANAIIHRDYSIRGTSLMVEVYDDRVVIINPGVFPWHQKKDFGKISVRRNERIADLFFRMDKVERAGTGIRRMKEAMAATGLPSPLISQTGFYTITFKRPVEMVAERGVESWEKKLGGKLGDRLGEKGAEDATQKTTQITTQKTTQKIIEAIAKKSDITQKELASVIGITEDGVKYHIIRLRKKGLIKRIGPDKGGHWEIVNA